MRAAFHHSMAPGLDPSGIQDAIRLRGLLHDLGHDLFTLSCLTRTVLDDREIAEGTRRRVSLIGQEISRLMELVHTAGDLPPVRHEVDVRALLTGIAAAAGECEPATVRVVPGDRIMVRTDEQALWRMVANLVGNAVRAVAADGIVELSVTEGDGVVAVEVSDDGTGLVGSTTGPKGWLSLGLAIVAGLADREGATLLMAPRIPCGTRIRLEFPAEDGGVR